MSERLAVVAGAGGPLGRAVAVKLAEAGYAVAGIDRNEDGLGLLPEGVHRVPGDPTDPAAAKRLIDGIASAIAPPDVLVNTIGAFSLNDAVSTTPDELRLMLDVNAGTALWLTQAVVPHMRERGSGSIVHVASRPALEPTAGMAAYGLSKAALSHLVRILDVELRPHGIRVNAVAPQLIDTPKNREFLPPEALTHAITPEAIAEIIAFLAGDAAAPVSGAILPAYGA